VPRRMRGPSCLQAYREVKNSEACPYRGTRAVRAHGARLALDTCTTCGYSRAAMPTPATSFRFPPALIKQLDRYAARLSRETGVPVSRAAAAAKLLAAALAAEAQAGGRRGRDQA
jgi:hypothetical protein